MKRLLKKKINFFGKEVSVFLVAILGVALVSAALVSYYGQINQEVTIASGVAFTGPVGICSDNVCTETGVALSSCESVESGEYEVDSSTSAVVPLSIETTGDNPEEGVTTSTEFLLDATEIPWDDINGYIGADFAAGREYVTVLTEGLTLGDLNSLVFEQMVLEGYPASVNILLDVDGDGVFDGKKDLTTGYLTGGEYDDVLKIEWAYNGVRPAFPYTDAGDYNRWFDVFDDVSVIDDTTNAWLYSVKPGDVEIVEGTLAEWKTGKSRGTTCYYVDDSWKSETCEDITVDSNTVVYGIQIESLGWIAASKSKVRNIKINGGSVEQPSLLAQDDLRFKTLTEVDCLAQPAVYTLQTTVTARP